MTKKQWSGIAAYLSLVTVIVLILTGQNNMALLFPIILNIIIGIICFYNAVLD